MPIAFALLICAAFLLLSACAGPQPVAQLEEARSALQRAEQAAAKENAPDIYRLAAQRIDKAEAMLLSKRFNRARLLLERASADAELAAVVSEAKTYEKSLSFMRPAAALPAKSE